MNRSVVADLPRDHRGQVVGSVVETKAQAAPQAAIHFQAGCEILPADAALITRSHRCQRTIKSNRVAELDAGSGKVLRWWPTGERTWGIGLSPDQGRLYAASGLSGTLTIIDLEQSKVVDTVKLGGRPWGAMAAPR